MTTEWSPKARPLQVSMHDYFSRDRSFSSNDFRAKNSSQTMNRSQWFYVGIHWWMNCIESYLTLSKTIAFN